MAHVNPGTILRECLNEFWSFLYTEGELVTLASKKYPVKIPTASGVIEVKLLHVLGHFFLLSVV
jgi:hypothetical protein